MRAALHRWHQRIAMVAGVAALLWGLTGLSHPLMVWSSPRPAAFASSPEPFMLTDALAPGSVMGLHDIERAATIRAVAAPSGDHALWLIRESDRSPTRYFDSRSGLELAGEDQRRAERLARHFAGDEDSAISSADYLTAFTPDYPEVNRLLPVWRIAFDRSDGLVAYIDSAGGRLATLDNALRHAFLFTFSNIHTLAFLPKGAEPARILLIGLLIGSLWAAALLALGLLLLLRNGRRRGARRWHRLLGYAAVIPALMFSTSGLYHLLHAADVSMPEPDAPARAIAAKDIARLPPLSGGSLAALIALDAGDGAVWRIDLAGDAADAPAMTADPHAHHRGDAPPAPTGDGPTLWLEAASGAPLVGGAENLVRRIAAEQAGMEAGRIATISRVDGFTAEYGFINKRLPVWRVAFADPEAPRLFIDPVDGVIAGRAGNADLREGVVFNALHKWRWLDGIGNRNRDLVIMGFVALILIVTLLGWRLQLARWRRS